VRGWLPLLGLAALVTLVVAGCPAPRDTVPETHDVRGTTDADAAAPTRRDDAYAYVVRRPHTAVGLVGAHFMTDADAHRIVDRIADDLEACARRLEQQGGLVSGAAQLVAITGSRGNGEVTDLHVSPGGAVAANALECIVAPVRASIMPGATRAGIPALAVEATWGPPERSAGDAGAADSSRP
jgi:hypothetical protein